jgi:hypothetical protein
MAIKFNCPKCKKELVVKDELAGKQGKCPACQSVLVVPAAPAPVTSRPAAAPAPAKKKRVEEEEVAAEVMDDDEEVAAEVEDDDDAPRKKKKSRRDDDEEDDRPSRSKKSSRRDDDDDDDDDRGSSKSDKEKRRLWQKAGTGLFLGFIGSWTYVGAMGLSTLALIILLIAAFAGSLSMAGFTVILGYLAAALLLTSMVLNLVSAIFVMTAPGKNGEFGLGITTVSLTGAAALLLVLYLAAPAVLFIYPLVEVARHVLYALLIWAACKSRRAYDTAAQAVRMAIVVPCVYLGGGTIALIIVFTLFSSPSKGALIVSWLTFILVQGAITFVMMLFTFMIGKAREDM